MAEFICPVCGKQNPAEAEFCENCGAELRKSRPESLPPANADQTAKNSTSPETSGSFSPYLPDWLNELSGRPLDEPSDQAENAESYQPSNFKDEWIDQSFKSGSEPGSEEPIPFEENTEDPVQAESFGEKSSPGDIPTGPDTLDQAENTAEEAFSGNNSWGLSAWLDRLQNSTPGSQTAPGSTRKLSPDSFENFLKDQESSGDFDTEKVNFPETLLPAKPDEDSSGLEELPDLSESEPQLESDQTAFDAELTPGQDFDSSAPFEDLSDRLPGLPEGKAEAAEEDSSSEPVEFPQPDVNSFADEIPEIPGGISIEKNGDSQETSTWIPELKNSPENRISEPVEQASSAMEPGSNDHQDLTPEPVDEQTIDSLLSMPNSEWIESLDQPETEENPATITDAQAEPANSLPQSELPSWVMAMRPSDILPEGQDAEKEIEEVGPLAGLHNILPTKQDKVEAYVPKSIHSSLSVTETQRVQAELMESILSNEKSPRFRRKNVKSSEIRWLRWVISIVLLSSMIIFAIFSPPFFQAPLTPTGSSPVGMTIKAIEAIPDSSPVLVVMDYQPDYIGEMESALGPVLNQLMSKHARLVFVSSTPMGGMLTEHLMQKLAGNFSYEAGKQYIYLGYLPGGSGGIFAFAKHPAYILGQGSTQENLWNKPVLKDYFKSGSDPQLSDFAAMVVSTDNADIGRTWIEQSGQKLGSKPMLMVVSAQSAPMLSPYIQSNQISGLVAGLEGGMIYNQAQKNKSTAGDYWDPFSAGVLATEILILIGAIWSLLASRRVPPSEIGQGEV